MFPIEKLFIESYLRKIVNCYCYECVNGQEYAPLRTSNLAANVSDLYIWNGCPCDECCHSYEKSDVCADVCKERCVIGPFDCMCFDCVRPEDYQTPELRYFDDIVVKKVAFKKYMYTDCLYSLIRCNKLYINHMVDVKRIDEFCELFLSGKITKNTVDGQFPRKWGTCHVIESNFGSKKMHCDKCKLRIDGMIMVDIDNIVWKQGSKVEYKYKKNKYQFWSNDCPIIVQGLLRPSESITGVSDWYDVSICDGYEFGTEHNGVFLNMNPKTIKNLFWYKEYQGFTLQSEYNHNIIINGYWWHKNDRGSYDRQITFAERLVAYKFPETCDYEEEIYEEEIYDDDLDKYYSKYKLHQYCFECNKYSGCCIPSDHEYPVPDEYKYVINKNDNEVVKLRKEVRELRDLLYSKIE